VRDFYVENSYGMYTPEFVVVGPYTARNPMAYYPQRSYELLGEAVNYAKSEVNYAEFDNTGDGFVDAVTIVFAGYGAEAGAQNTI
jgi:immune inhibitor A